jgi:hypothetical protein
VTKYHRPDLLLIDPTVHVHQLARLPGTFEAGGTLRHRNAAFGMRCAEEMKVESADLVEFVRLAPSGLMDHGVGGWIDGIPGSVHLKEMYVVRYAGVGVGFVTGRNQIAVRIVRVIPARVRDHPAHRHPWTSVACRGAEDSFVGSAEINVEPPRIVADGASLNLSACAFHLVPMHLWTDCADILHHVTNDGPLDEIAGVQHRHPWRILEGRMRARKNRSQDESRRDC